MLPFGNMCVQLHEWSQVAFVMGSEALFIDSWSQWKQLMEEVRVQCTQFIFTPGEDKSQLLQSVDVQFRIIALVCAVAVFAIVHLLLAM